MAESTIPQVQVRENVPGDKPRGLLADSSDNIRGVAAAPTIGDGLRPLVALALGGLVPLLIYNDTWTGTAVLVGVVAAYTGIVSAGLFSGRSHGS